MMAREGQEQLAGSGCISVSSVLGVNTISQVATIHGQMVCIANSEFDTTDFLILINQYHLESVGWHIVDGRVTGIPLRQNQFQVAIDQSAWVRETRTS